MSKSASDYLCVFSNQRNRSVLYSIGLILIFFILLCITPASATGEALKIDTDPIGASVYVDGYYYGKTDTDFVRYGLSDGSHTVYLTLDGYVPYEEVIDVRPGGSNGVYHKFKPLPTSGQIVFKSTPSDAEIYLNNELVGRTSLTLDGVDPGSYSFVIKKEGYDDYLGTVDVSVGMISTIDAVLVPSKVYLNVDTTPEGASLYVDDLYIGTTPNRYLTDQGTHTIRIEKFGYRTIEESITLGYRGESVSYTLVSTALEAIADAEAEIERNAYYNPVSAKEYVEKAKAAYSLGDIENAIYYAQFAMAAANDVDADNITNDKDMLPQMQNLILYIAPFIILIIVIALVAIDIMRNRVRPEILLKVPSVCMVDDTEASFKVITDITKGSMNYRGYVCTVYIDNTVVEHFTESGEYNVHIAGTFRELGRHGVLVELQILKKRYGSAQVKSEASYTVIARQVPDNKSVPEYEKNIGAIFDGSQTKDKDDINDTEEKTTDNTADKTT